jgi:hypothetical protein
MVRRLAADLLTWQLSPQGSSVEEPLAIGRNRRKKDVMCRRLKLVRYAILLLAAPLLIWLTSATVLAAPPENDTISGATPVTAGFSEVIDTSEATTDPDDTLPGHFCGVPATEASVWYAFTTTEDTRILVDASGSDYSAHLIVSVGNPFETVVGCGASTALFFAGAGTIYYVLAYDTVSGGHGGQLSISFTPVPPPTLDLTVDRTGQFNAKTGSATFFGTYTCSNTFSFNGSIVVSQSVGRIATISGSHFIFPSGPCDGTPYPWSAEVFPQSGQFQGGKALVRASIFTCDPFECPVRSVEQTVQLRGGSKGGASAAATGVHLFLPFVQGGHP